MKHLISTWKKGWQLLYSDEQISFYTFFTIIFAESSYFWDSQPVTISIPFNAVLMGYIINVLLSALGKALYKKTKKEVLITIIYLLTFIILFMIGCFVNIFISIIITIIPFGMTALWIRFREYQKNMLTYAKIDKFVEKILKRLTKIGFELDKLAFKKTLYILSQLLFISIPFIIFAIFFKFIPIGTLLIKNIVLIIYLIIIPFISLLEKELSTYNIFELAYIYYNPKNKLEK